MTGSIPIELGNLSNINELYRFRRIDFKTPWQQSIDWNDSFRNPKNSNIQVPFILFFTNSIQYKALIEVSNIGTFKSSSFDGKQIERYLAGVSIKRAFAATVIGVRTLCRFNDAFENEEILNQCLAAVTQHCSAQKNFPTCKSLYDETFRESVFNGMEICAPWNSGFKSTQCQNTANRVKLRFTAEEIKYKQQFVDFIKNDLFSSRDYAPCYVSAAQKSCNY